MLLKLYQDRGWPLQACCVKLLGLGVVVQISLLGVDAMVESGGLAAPGALAAPLQVPLIQPTPNRPPLGTVPDVRRRQTRWNTP